MVYIYIGLVFCSSVNVLINLCGEKIYSQQLMQQVTIWTAYLLIKT